MQINSKMNVVHIAHNGDVAIASVKRNAPVSVWRSAFAMHIVVARSDDIVDIACAVDQIALHVDVSITPKGQRTRVGEKGQVCQFVCI